MGDPLKRGKPITPREVRVLCPPGYGPEVEAMWPDVRGTATRVDDTWTLVECHPPSAGPPAWYPPERIVDAPPGT